MEAGQRVLVTDDVGVSVCGWTTGQTGQRGQFRGHHYLRFPGRLPTIAGQNGKTQAVPAEWFVAGDELDITCLGAYEWRARKPRRKKGGEHG